MPDLLTNQMIGQPGITLPDVQCILNFLPVLSPTQSTREHEWPVILRGSFYVAVLLQELQAFIKLFPSEGNQPNFAGIFAVRFSLKQTFNEVFIEFTTFSFF